MNITIKSLDDDRYNLKKPVKMSVVWDESLFIGEIKEIGVYVYGDTKQELIKQAKEDIMELYEDLIGFPDELLGEHPLKWKIFLMEIIKYE